MRRSMVDLVRSIFHLEDRRNQTLPVINDRRRPKMQHAEAQLRASIDRLEQTVSMRREEWFADKTIGVLNGHRREVQFQTFADICRYGGSRELTVRLCRHPEHAAAGTGIAKCDESVCPEMIKACRGP